MQELNRLGVNLNFVLEDDSLKEIFLEELSYKANFENPNVPLNIRAIQEQGFFVAGFESPFIYNKQQLIINKNTNSAAFDTAFNGLIYGV